MRARGRSTLASLAQLVTALLISDDTPGGLRGASAPFLRLGGISPTDSFFSFFAQLLEVLAWFWPLVRLLAVFNNLPTHGANIAIIGTPVVSFGFLIHGIVYTHCLSNTRANKVSFYCLLFALVSKHFIVL